MTQTVDSAVERAAVFSANRHTRKGFFGRVAALTTALATAGLTLDPDPALAVCPGTTVTCNTLYGFNHCSANTCTDGSWVVPPGNCDSVSNCGPLFTRWRDCCADCGCHTAYGSPSCCSSCIYATGGNCSPSSKVRCRFWGCAA